MLFKNETHNQIIICTALLEGVHTVNVLMPSTGNLRKNQNHV